MTTSTPPSPVVVACLCRTITVPAYELLGDTAKEPPFSVELCHCNTCRTTSGGLAGCFVTLASPPPTSALSQCVEYASSGKVSRFFCAKCGSHVFLRGYINDEAPNVWFGWGAALNQPDARDDEMATDLIQANMQVFVNDTIDGGLFGRMVETIGTPKDTKDSLDSSNSLFAAVHAESWNEPPLTADAVVRLANQLHANGRAKVDQQNAESIDGRIEQSLHAECHCGAIQFQITRPIANEQYPNHVAKHYVKADGHKWVGRVCCCRSCTAATGCPPHPWVYVPPEHIMTRNNEQVGFVSGGAAPQLQGMKQYESSKGITWSFCGTCGATVFYERSDRPRVIDVAVGILKSATGSLAEDFIEWEWDEPGSVQECRAKELLKAIAGGEKVVPST